MVKKNGEFISIVTLLALFLLPSVSAAPLDRIGDLLKDSLGRVFFDFTRVGQSTFDLWIRVLIFFILFSLLYLILHSFLFLGQEIIMQDEHICRKQDAWVLLLHLH